MELKTELAAARGGTSITLRGPEKNGSCVRAAFHALDSSRKNSDGILDVGLVGWTPEWVPTKFKPWADPKDLAQAKFVLCIDGGTTGEHFLR